MHQPMSDDGQSLFHLGQGAHTCGNDKRFAGACKAPEQWAVGEFAGRHFVQGQVQVGQKIKTSAEMQPLIRLNGGDELRAHNLA